MSDIDKLAGGQSRPGCKFRIPPEMIDLTHAFWTDGERANGVDIRLYQATPQDERDAANSVGPSRGGGLTITVAMAGAMFALGVVGDRPVTSLNREIIWRALGPNGRSAVVIYNSKMNSVSEEVSKKLEDSFQIVV